MSENPTHVLSGLINYHNKEIKAISNDLQHLNTSIKIFNPE